MLHELIKKGVCPVCPSEALTCLSRFCVPWVYFDVTRHHQTLTSYLSDLDDLIASLILSVTMGAQGLIARGVPPQPLWLLYIKIAILVLSLIVLGLGAWAVSLTGGGYYGYYYSSGAGGMVIFVVRTYYSPTHTSTGDMPLREI